ncbi:hypothetical protein VE00_10424 [Pseudogymnoascus sp. WSF 3629]|nr:hypothetical protein VE00_10424 [Pseudogymnoascus sp. WSF 3629]
MDNGTLQQEQATKIKHIVRQTSRSKRRRWTVNSDALSLECGSSQALSLSASVDGLLDGWGDEPTQNNIFPGVGVIDTTSLDESTWTNLFDNDSLASQALLSPNGITELSKTSLNVDLERPLISTGSADTIFDSSSELVDARQSEGMWDDSETRDDLLTSDGTAWTSCSDKEIFLESRLESATHYQIHPVTRCQKDALTAGISGPQITALAGMNRLASGGETEDMLFMHYLDQVFYIQYPFFDAHKKQKRGWLLSILKGVKSAYHASLALSEHHLLSTQFRNSETTTSLMKLRSKDSYYYLANQEMELSVGGSSWWDESIRLVRSIECLACILQLLFLEIFAGGADNWQNNLRTAAGFLPAIIQGSTSLVPGHLRDRNIRSSEPIQKSLGAKESEAINFLLGSFIALDIISCASTRSAPLLDIEHISMLQTLDVDSRSFIGCDNTIMILIFEISQLDSWKKDANESQKLSIVELAKRGSRIEERIHRKIADIENASLSRLSSKRDSRLLLMSAYADINRIFAFSAIVYLHVVISGAHPELPEVKEVVSKTLAALQSLEDKELLVNTVWAFCISGSLAVESQQGSFRELFSAAKVTHSTVGSFAEAFKIMETCWEMRRNGSCSCDWVSAMDKLGRYVLLR